MKAFLVGLIFVLAAAVLGGIGVLFAPLVLVLGLIIRVLIALFFVLFCIWLLGKFIIFVFESLREKK